MPLLPFASAPGSTPQATFTSSGKVKQSFYNVMDYGAVGNGTTDDTTAIAAAITAAASTQGEVFLPALTFLTSSALNVPNGIHIRGESKRDSVITNTTSDVFSFAANASWWEIDHLKVSASGGNIFAGSHNLSAFNIHHVTLQQNANGFSVWSQSGGTIVEGYFSYCDFYMGGSAPTVPGFSLTDTASGFNSNVFEQCVCTTNSASSAYFFNWQATGANNASYGNVFRDVVFEQTVGGALFLNSHLQVLLENVQVWDGNVISSSTADFIHIGKSSTGLTSRGVRILNYLRASSTLGTSLYDISLDSNTLQVYIDTPRSGPDTLNINLNNAPTAQVIGQSTGTTITNGLTPSMLSGSGNPNSTAVWNARVGDIYFDQAASSGTSIWRCTVAGKPGTWVAAASGGTTNNFNSISFAQANLTGSGLTALTGSVNGSNTTFTVPGGVYISGTLTVYLNGVLQVLGDAIAQTTPASGIFDFVTAPLTGDQVYVVFQTSTVTSSTYLVAANNLSDVASASTSRTNLGLAIGTNVEAWNANLDAFALKTAPTGAVVGTSDTQTLTNKTTTGLKMDGIQDTGGIKTVEIDANASGVNYLVLTPASTGQAVVLQGNGSDTDVYLNLVTKGAGLVRLNGVNAVDVSSAQTLTTKRITKRVSALSANSATPAINTDTTDVVHITAQTAAITSFTTNLTGTPVDGDTLRISVTGTTSVALTFGTSFEASTVALPTTTSGTTRLDMGFFWNTETSKWRCEAVA